MTLLRKSYLALAGAGFVLPMWHLIQHWRDHGPGLADLIAAWTVTAGSRALAWDLVIAAAVFFIWVVAETTTRRNWHCLWAIPATLFVGLSFGMPIYLFLRTVPAKDV